MTEPFLQLAAADLFALGAAMRAGRLFAPFSAVTLQRFCAADRADPVAQRLQQMADEGMRPEHLALLLESVGRARQGRVADDVVDLVWTGPEAPGTVNRDTAVVVRELFAAARSHVLVAGYAVYQGREVFRSLAERMAQRPGLVVRMFLDVQRSPGDVTPDAEVLARFVRRFRQAEWPGDRLPELYYDPRSLHPDAGKRSCLHAKCVVMDRRVAFVSSANFTEAAQVRNIEAGVLIHSEHFADKLARHFETMVMAGLLLPLP